MSYAEVLKAAQELSPQEQWKLVEELGEAIESPFDDELMAELDRRDAEVEAGRMKVHSWDEVKRQGRAGEIPLES